MRLIIATCLIFVLGAGTAHAAPDLVIKPDRKPKVRIFLDQHANKADVNNRKYVVRNAQGPRTVTVAKGFSLKTVLGIAGVKTVKGYVKIAGEAVVLLDRPNVRATPYADGPPVIYRDEEGRVIFLRPERRDGEKYNAKDVFGTKEGTPLVITEFDEQLLGLKISASETEIDPGDSVDFTAKLTQPSGSNAQIAWTATGQDGKSGTSVTYKFPDEGTFSVSARVTDENDRVGEDSVEIQVGDPVESDTNQDGGGLNNDLYAPDTGPYYGPGGATPNFPDLPDTGARFPDQPPVKIPDPGDAGVQVTGELLSETGPYVPPAPEELVGARSGTPEQGASWTLPGIGLGASLVVGLLGFGAGREFEHLPVQRLRNLLPF